MGILRPKARACSFCGQSEAKVSKLLAGPSRLHICNQCVELCNRILESEPPVDKPSKDELLGSLRSTDLAAASLRELLASRVDQLRALGATWREIGDSLGVSRQAAWERFHHDN